MLRGEKIVFTGKLDTLSRKQAQNLVSALGGKPQAAVTKDTTILVVGKATTNLFQEDPRSLKMQKVEALQQEGRPICVLSEKTFLERVATYLNQVVGIMKVSEKQSIKGAVLGVQLNGSTGKRKE